MVKAIDLISECEVLLAIFHPYSLLGSDRKPDFKDVAKRVDAAGWMYLLESCGLGSLMDHRTRDKFRTEMTERPLPLTLENAVATFENLSERRTEIMAQGIIETFKALNWRLYKSNSAFKLNPDGRIIVSQAVNMPVSYSPDWSPQPSYEGVDKIADLLRCFMVLDGKKLPQNLTGAVRDFMKDHSHEGHWPKYHQTSECEYFRVRMFKNGNMHVWFKRADIVEKMNRLLAHHFGQTLPDDRKAS
jgi:hypothetical protein